MTLLQTEPTSIKIWSTDIKKVYLGTTQVRPKPDYLCFTAEAYGSTISLNAWSWSPAAVSLETSTDWRTWTAYTIWDTITLTNIWDKVYWRNTSTTDTRFSISISDFYTFAMTWNIAASGDVNYLLNKNSTDTLSDSCFAGLFRFNTSLTAAPELPATTISSACYYTMFIGCTSLVTPPELPATTVYDYSYSNMFSGCTNLTSITKLPATSLQIQSYYRMFRNCSSIKLSTTKTWAYQTEYRVPISWTGSNQYAVEDMFYNTWGTFKGTPTLNTTYYTSNTLV